MKDYHQTGMYNEIESLLLVYREINNVMYIKLSGNNTQQTMSFIETNGKRFSPISLLHIPISLKDLKGSFRPMKSGD